MAQPKVQVLCCGVAAHPALSWTPARWQPVPWGNIRILKCPPLEKQAEGCSSHRAVGPGKGCGMESWISGMVWTGIMVSMEPNHGFHGLAWNHGFVEWFGLKVPLKTIQFQPRESYTIGCDPMPSWQVSTEGFLNSPFYWRGIFHFPHQEGMAAVGCAVSICLHLRGTAWLPANPALCLSAAGGFFGRPGWL